MSDITNPQAIAFSNNVIRPLCQQMRALKARITQASTEWFLGLNNQFPNDTSDVVDGRTAEGIAQLTGADINSAMGDLISAAAAINDQIIEKPCVAPLVAS